MLGRVYTKPNNYKPFIITVHCKTGKPEDTNIYLFKFKDELNRILKDGIEISGKKWEINIMYCIYDTPSRVFTKCINGYTGFYACETCTPMERGFCK